MRKGQEYQGQRGAMMTEAEFRERCEDAMLLALKRERAMSQGMQAGPGKMGKGPPEGEPLC